MTQEQLHIINLAVHQCSARYPLVDVQVKVMFPFEGESGVILTTARGRKYGLANPDEYDIMLTIAKVAGCGMQVSSSQSDEELEFLFL